MPPDEADALTTALIQVMDDPELRARLMAGAEAAAARITWPALAAETYDIYASLYADAAP